MNLYIMSRGRAGRTNTQNWIPEGWRHKTIFVVPRVEVEDYYRVLGDRFRVMAAHPLVTNYSQKFQWIMDGLPEGPGAVKQDPWEKCLILDDDLVFSMKNGKSLKTIRDPNTMGGLFWYMEKLLDGFPLVGVHPRQMGNNAKQPYEVNGRIICMQGINREHTRGIKVDAHPILADVVLSCTLLSRGLANALVTTYFQDHGPCQAPGGCSLYRTPDMQRAAVDYLVSRFPGYVKAVERRPKVARWMGDVRYEYTCQWKKLFSAGVAWREGRGPSPDREETSIPARDNTEYERP